MKGCQKLQETICSGLRPGSWDICTRNQFLYNLNIGGSIVTCIRAYCNWQIICQCWFQIIYDIVVEFWMTNKRYCLKFIVNKLSTYVEQSSSDQGSPSVPAEFAKVGNYYQVHMYSRFILLSYIQGHRKLNLTLLYFLNFQESSIILSILSIIFSVHMV